MNCRWIKTEDFNFSKETEFDCYIFWDNEVKKAKYEFKQFSFNYGMCGIKVPSHVMKIPTPKSPKI
jgi:hypothetical protein